MSAVHPIEKRPKDLTGQRFGRLTVISFSHARGKNRWWLCKCQCGGHTTTTRSHLVAGKSQSCGCLHREISANVGRSTRVHGQSKTTTHRAWQGMFDRSENSNSPAYDRYGGRGITVCERWRTFTNFLADMGQRPKGLSIDRIDNNGNYEPGNCRWATPTEQSNNRRNIRRYAFAGKTLTLTEWAKETGIPFHSLYARIFRNHWPIEKALTTEVS